MLQIGDVTWGYKHPLVDLANLILPPEQKLPDLYGYFYGINMVTNLEDCSYIVGKNGTSDGEFDVLTGSEDVSMLGSILSFDNKTKLNAWGNGSAENECNAIHGTDGSVFPPFVTKNNTFHIFQKDMCRSLPIQYSVGIKQNELESTVTMVRRQ